MLSGIFYFLFYKDIYMIYMHFPDRLCFVLINLSLYYLFPSLLHSVDTLCLAYTAVTLIYVPFPLWKSYSPFILPRPCAIKGAAPIWFIETARSGAHLREKGSNNISLYPTQVCSWTNCGKDHWAHVGSLVIQSWWQKKWLWHYQQH